ncbi:TonB-dependent receptor [Tsuneonella sp. YG55]|uniref:TonB-dependent receptor n=1 Tax=Tsuneonella litorea TaxID=2976475 RepID=A0A9X2VYC1_9SPHN|nr:TonB-dependent receptor [Tsuneonella litorea]MCT2557376.1 TonB-dependent receptor [Tsuneonella litorea]
MADAPSDTTALDPPRRPAGEIIVTGERVPRTIRQTPSSVVVIDEAAIEAASADRLDQVLDLVPNVQAGSGEEGAAIRGQDSTGLLRNLFAFLGGTRPRVTVQIDGRPVTYYEYVASSAPLWDVERVEVWRSPQTTTQGRNSVAGAIFIETADPAFEWEGKGRAIIGGIGTRQVSALVSGPVVADQVALRVSGDLRLGRMASDMADGIAGADIDRDDYGILRAKLLFTPTALPGTRIETSFVHTESQAPQFEAVRIPFEERRDPVPERTNGIHRVNVDSVTARLHHEAGAALAGDVTLSFGDAQVRRFGLPGLGQTHVDSHDYSVEGILHWQPRDASLSLLAGINHITTRQVQTIDITGLGVGAGQFRDRQASLGLFGEATWRPAERIAITGGLRYQTDRQQRAGLVGTPPAGFALDYDGRFDGWLPKLSLAVDIAPGTTVGAMIQRAYNPGGTSISLVRRAQDDFGQETLWNRELFARSTFAGGRGIVAVNLFRSSIRDAQRQQLVQIQLPGGTPFFAPEFENAPRARTQGFELEAGYRFGERLSLRGAFGLLGTRVLETLLPLDPTLGRQFQRSPRVSAAASADWQPVQPVRLSATIRHHGAYFSDDANTPALVVPSATVVDARGSWAIGRANVFAYARNLFDRFHMTYLFDLRFGTAADPRELGIGIEARI